MTNEASPPQVSVIVPVYNLEPYIGKCLASLLAQSVRDIEILVADDGSSDNSADIVRGLCETDARIRFFSLAHGGVSRARNHCLAQARGEWITFVDGDDTVGRTYLADLLDRAAETKAQLVICGFSMVAEDGTVLSRHLPPPYVRGKHEEAVARHLATCGRLYHRSLFDQYDIRFDGTDAAVRGEDIPFSLFYSVMCESAAALPRADYYYLQHASSAMGHFRGLRDMQLPFRALNDVMSQIRLSGGPKSDPLFYEWFVLRIFASFIDLSRGAKKEQIDALEVCMTQTLQTFFPSYADNPYIGLFSSLDVPFSQKAAVRLLVFLQKNRLLRLFLRVYCRA